MARKPPSPKNKPQQETSSNTFLDALRFVASAAEDIGPPYKTHVRLGGNWAVMFNGVVGTGHKIVEDLFACPHINKLVEALSKCGEGMNLTQLEARLSIKSGKFRALIPCCDPVEIAGTIPDPPIAAIDDRLRAGLEVIGFLASETGQHVHNASVLLRAGSVVATDGHLVLEWWHGIDLPPGLALPKAAVNALVKKSKKLTRFGFTPGNSCTFYFEDESWIKTQLYSQPWPDVDRILNCEVSAWPLPEGFYQALSAVTPFSEDGFVRFGNGVMRSHDIEDAGAQYELPGLPNGPVFNAKYLKAIAPFTKSIDFFAGPDKQNAYFFGNNIRGALTGVARPQERLSSGYIETPVYSNNIGQDIRPGLARNPMDDEIPF